MKAKEVPTTAVRLGRILREDARPGAGRIDRTIAACRAALDDEDTGERARFEVRKYLDELLENRGCGK